MGSPEMSQGEVNRRFEDLILHEYGREGFEKSQPAKIISAVEDYFEVFLKHNQIPKKAFRGRDEQGLNHTSENIYYTDPENGQVKRESDYCIYVGLSGLEDGKQREAMLLLLRKQPDQSDEEPIEAELRIRYEPITGAISEFEYSGEIGPRLWLDVLKQTARRHDTLLYRRGGK